MDTQNRIDIEKLEYTDEKALWVKSLNDANIDDEIKRIIRFYVVETPVPHISARKKDMTEYGWPADVMKKKNFLETKMLHIAGLQYGKNLFTCSKREEEKEMFNQAELGEMFFEKISENRIAMICNRKNIIGELLRHIRNAFAHCRVEIMKADETEFVVLENGQESGGRFEVKARMVLQKKTLIEWIDFIEKGASLEAQERKKKELEDENRILSIIKQNNVKIKADEIRDRASMKRAQFKIIIGRLKSKGKIEYDSHSRKWKICA